MRADSNAVVPNEGNDVMSEQPASANFRVLKRLHEMKLPFVRMVHAPVYTSAEAAQVRGSDLHSGAKALIMRTDDKYLMAVIPADLSLDNSALRTFIGSRHLRFATKDELLELTGLTPGSVPPFGSLFDMPTICDERLAENAEINFNVGSHTESVRLAYADYLRAESPRIAKIAKSNPSL